MNRNRLSKAAYLWNNHTNPGVCRSDFEHGIHRKASRKIMRFIEKHFSYKYDYRISDHTGRIIPMHETIYIDER